MKEFPTKWVKRKKLSSKPLAAITLFFPMDERYREPIRLIMSS
jgi:hypothetical protein